MLTKKYPGVECLISWLVNDSGVKFIDIGDDTQLLTFQNNSNTGTTTTLESTQTTNRIITLLNTDDILVGRDATQTLANKTISGSSNTLTNILASSIADGSVDNSKFQTLNGVTSNIQTQLSNKAPNNASYLLLSSNVSLPNSRTLISTSEFTQTDGGAGNPLSLDLATKYVIPGSYTRATIDVDIKGRLTSVISSTSVFGTEYESAQDTTASNTTSTTFVNKLTLNTAVKPAGIYRIGFYYEWALASAFANYNARVQLDGSDISSLSIEPTTTGGTSNIPGSDTNQRNVVDGFYYATFGTSTTHSITIDFTGFIFFIFPFVGSIQNARIEIWRVS